VKSAALLFLSIPLFAQISTRPTPVAANTTNPPAPVVGAPKSAVRIPLKSFSTLERDFDAKLAAMAGTEAPVDLVGATRGIYLDGYGAVFTTEMDLVVTPRITPFNRTITDVQKTGVHSAKVTRLAALRKAIAAMMQTAAGSLIQVPDGQLIVVAVRLDYAPWENTAGLPGLIVAKADRRSAVAGNIQVEEQ